MSALTISGADKMRTALLICILTAWIASQADAQGYVKYDPPRIYPSTPNGDMMVQPGSTLQLRCESKRPVHWNFTDNEDLASRVNVTQWENLKEEYSYVTNLTVINMVYTDVGFFYCVEDGITNLQRVEKVGKVYVYVNDSDHLLVGTKQMDFLTVMHHQSVVIPCRPTSPSVTLSLVLNSNEEVVPSEQNFMEYDPRIGYTITNAQIARHSGTFECTASRNDKSQSSAWEIIILHFSDSYLYSYDPKYGIKIREVFAKDSIRRHICRAKRENMTAERIYVVYVQSEQQVIPKPHMNDTLAIPAILGGNITISCSIHMELGVFFDMDWDIPHPGEPGSNHTFITTQPPIIKSLNGIDYRMTITTLDVYNLTKEDEGYYTCTVKSHSNKRNNESKFIEIIEQNTSYLDLIADKTQIQVKANTHSVQWVIKKHAYPDPEIIWFDPDGREIKSSAKFEITNDKKQTILKINSILINDAGKYTLKAQNKFKSQVLNLTLIVVDRPAVMIENTGQHYFTYNNEYTITCKVLAFPQPNITWLFRNCTEYDYCIGDMRQITDQGITEYCGVQCMTKSLKVQAQDSGQLTCHAQNEIGLETDTMPIFVTDVANGFSLEGPPDYIQGDNVTLFCGASVYNYTGEIRWYFDNGRNFKELTNQSGHHIVDTSTRFSYQKRLLISNIQKNQSGTYICRVAKMISETKESITEEEEALTFTVRGVIKPKFKKTNLNGTDIRVKELGSPLDMVCHVTGVPKPNITWYKDGRLFTISKQDKNTSRIIMRENNEILSYPYFRKEDAGIYKCVASNRAGSISGSASVTIDEKWVLSTSVIILMAFLGAVVLLCIFICVVFLCWKKQMERKWRLNLAADFAKLEHGCIESLDPGLSVDDQAELLPYDQEWEVARDRIKLGKQLGAGAFGRVLKGILEGDNALTTVAVKMVKPHADLSYVRALMSELKIMIHLGKHLNVVNLLGACTRDLGKCELLVIVEYCRFGNIQNYLLRHREEFINQVDPVTGNINYRIGSELLSGIEKARRKELEAEGAVSLKYASLALSSDGPAVEVDYRGGDSAGSDFNSALSQTTTQTVVSMSPSGGHEEVILDSSCSTSSSSMSNQPVWRNNYRGDYKGADVRPISTTDLICWAFQIARGMEYLASRKVLHRDLAARNILLGEDNVVKICDFGLAKEMLKSENYKKKGEGLLPVKWMAIESIQDRIFSTQSDVWSFGIVLWELFSLGRTPYPGMEPDEKLYQKILDGYRMEKPKYATADLYKIFLDCWRKEPTHRPSFSQLAAHLGDLLEEGTKDHYLNLNKPYLMMNEQWQVQNPDYLGMMVSPDYANVIQGQSNSLQQPYMNIPAMGQDGYLMMSPDCSGSKPTDDLLQDESGYLRPRTDGSGYLWMKRKEPESGSPEPDIFSPRPPKTGGKFTFDGHAVVPIREPEKRGANNPELRPMLNPDSDDERCPSVVSQDSGLASPNGFFNPTYRSLGDNNVSLDPNPADYTNLPPISETDEGSVGGKERQDSGNGSHMSIRSDDSSVFINDVDPKGFLSPPPSYNRIVNGVGDQYKL